MRQERSTTSPTAPEAAGVESTVRCLALTARDRDRAGGAREHAARSGPNIAGIEVADDGRPSEVLECAGPGGQFPSEKVDAILAAHQLLPLGEDVEGALAELRDRALRHDRGSR